MDERRRGGAVRHIIVAGTSTLQQQCKQLGYAPSDVVCCATCHARLLRLSCSRFASASLPRLRTPTALLNHPPFAPPRPASAPHEWHGGPSDFPPCSKAALEATVGRLYHGAAR